MENDLVKNNIKLVHYIVHKLGNLPKDLYEDYFQEGCYWLILAAERFDKSKGFAFSTFAANYIYNSIRRYKRENGDDFNGLKVSRGIRDNIAKMNVVASMNSLDLENKEDLNLVLDYLDLEEFEIPSITSFDIDIKGKDGSVSSQYDIVSDIKEPFSDINMNYDLLAYLRYIKPKVSNKAYEVISFLIDTYIHTGDITFTQIELAELLDTSQTYISRIRVKCLELWKEFFN